MKQDAEMRVGAATGTFGACRAVGWSLEDSANRMMRASLFALKDGDEEGARREQIIAIREYEWAARLYEVLGMDEDFYRARRLGAAAQAGEWKDPQ